MTTTKNTRYIGEYVCDDTKSDNSHVFLPGGCIDEYFDVCLCPTRWEIECPHCRTAWSHPLDHPSPGTVLRLLNHAYKHRDTEA